MTKHYCGQCNAYIRLDFCPACFERTNERASSPLESVVQGRPERPVPLNPDRSGHADILAQLRDRALQEQAEAIRRIGYWTRNCESNGAEIGLTLANSRLVAFAEVRQWLDELSECQTNNTAPDTKSGSAGVPGTL